MISLKFSGKPRKIGNSWGVTIPIAIVKLLDNQVYEFEISQKEVEQNESKPSVS